MRNLPPRHLPATSNTVLLLCLESLRDSLPVDDIPDSTEVFGLSVLVLQVVGVLPCVNTEQGDQVASNRVLVSASNKGQRATLLVLRQPRPTATLDTSKSCVGLLLEGREGSEVTVDRFLFVDSNWSARRELFDLLVFAETYLQISLGLTTTVLVRRRQVLPEEGVVQVATSVEVQQRRNASGLSKVALGFSLVDGVESTVQAVDIGLVVLGVVKFHDLAGDVGFECAVVVLGSQGVSLVGIVLHHL